MPSRANAAPAAGVDRRPQRFAGFKFLMANVASRLGRAYEPSADVVELVEVTIFDAQGSALA